MRIRPFIVYLGTFVGITIYGIFNFKMFYIYKLFLPFTAGLIIGSLIGFFIGRKAFLFVDPLLIVEGQVSGDKAYDIFGPSPYRWLIEIWIVYSLWTFFIFTDPRTLGAESAIFDGLFNGIVLLYYLYFGVKAFLKEQRFNDKIITTIG